MASQLGNNGSVVVKFVVDGGEVVEEVGTVSLSAYYGRWGGQGEAGVVVGERWGKLGWGRMEVVECRGVNGPVDPSWGGRNGLRGVWRGKVRVVGAVG